MSNYSEKKWKYLSFALIGILGSGVLATQAYAASPTDIIIAILNELKPLVINTNNKVNTNLDATVSSRATPADITAAKNAINAHTDTAIGSIPSGITPAQYQVLKCNSGIIRPHVDLSGCNFSGDVDFSNSHLSAANFGGAQLGGINFAGTKLWASNFGGAYLKEANLSGTDLEASNLSNANLEIANLSNAEMPRADLRGANLTDANLSGAYLEDADFTGANTSGANFSGCTGTPIGISPNPCTP